MAHGDQLLLLPDEPVGADKAVIKSSYELALTSLARLVAYGHAGEYSGVDGEVATRQTQLATDDLLHLSISLRRLITATGVHSRAKNIGVPRVRFTRTDRFGLATYIDGTYDLWSIIGKTIHSTEIEIFNYSAQLLRGSLTFLDAYHVAVYRDEYKFLPVCFLKTENGQEVMFHIAALCEAADKIIEIAAERATDFDIYLGSYYND